MRFGLSIWLICAQLCSNLRLRQASRWEALRDIYTTPSTCTLHLLRRPTLYNRMDVRTRALWRRLWKAPFKVRCVVRAARANHPWMSRTNWYGYRWREQLQGSELRRLWAGQERGATNVHQDFFRRWDWCGELSTSLPCLKEFADISPRIWWPPMLMKALLFGQPEMERGKLRDCISINYANIIISDDFQTFDNAAMWLLGNRLPSFLLGAIPNLHCCGRIARAPTSYYIALPCDIFGQVREILPLQNSFPQMVRTLEWC